MRASSLPPCASDRNRMNNFRQGPARHTAYSQEKHKGCRACARRQSTFLTHRATAGDGERRGRGVERVVFQAKFNFRPLIPTSSLLCYPDRRLDSKYSGFSCVHGEASNCWAVISMNAIRNPRGAADYEQDTHQSHLAYDQRCRKECGLWSILFTDTTDQEDGI